MKIRHILIVAMAALSAISCKSAISADDWAPAGDRIMTSWGENLDPTNVLPEYPRPQLVRDQWQNLNGLWHYAITAADAEPEKMDGAILVPIAVESALSVVGRAVTENDAIWYSRQFEVPQ
ncbi:MAG: beta-galactosidase, partial [Bacteroidales bacterium]|nr:beta-galactosidase [Bacteroidales bacterium]